MYWIVGIDGKEYGPVDVAGLIQWAHEGRVTAGTTVIERPGERTCLARDLPAIAAVFSPPPVVGHAAQQQYVQVAMPTNVVKVGPDGRPLKSKLAAGLLGILLGCFGAHRFYLGYSGVGTAMLLITILTCGYGGIITGVWGLIEGIMCLTGSMVDSEGRPLAD